MKALDVKILINDHKEIIISLKKTIAEQYKSIKNLQEACEHDDIIDEVEELLFNHNKTVLKTCTCCGKIISNTLLSFKGVTLNEI